MINSSGSSIVTLRDIARKLGIHHSTVGRALQNAPNISLARRKEIQDAARQMGYQPNAMATALSHQRHSLPKRTLSAEVAWINCWDDPRQLRKYLEFDLYWKGAKSRAEQNGYRLEEFVCGHQLSPVRLEKILLARNIRGILIPPHRGDEVPQGWNEINWEKFCVVRFGYSFPTPNTHLATSNQMAAAQLAIENMHRLGYKRIGFVAESGGYRNFKAGFLVKQADFGAALETSIFTFAPAQDLVPKLTQFSAWLKKTRPDAILSDVVATRQMLTRLGYRIPEDIGLAATSILDGNADAGIDQKSEEIGKAAMDTLISLLNHNEHGIPAIFREVLITGTWVDGTTLPAR